MIRQEDAQKLADLMLKYHRAGDRNMARFIADVMGYGYWKYAEPELHERLEKIKR